MIMFNTEMYQDAMKNKTFYNCLAKCQSDIPSFSSVLQIYADIRYLTQLSLFK